jgi:hypothetical protein
VDDWVEQITGGRVAEVTIVLTSIVAALAFYQVFLMAVGYGKVKLPFLDAKPASRAHRAIGDSVVSITLLIGLMCLAYFGIEDGVEHAYPAADEGRVVWHLIVSFALFGVLALKIVVLRWWHSMGKYLPILGLSVFGLFIASWVTSSGAYLLSNDDRQAIAHGADGPLAGGRRRHRDLGDRVDYIPDTAGSPAPGTERGTPERREGPARR